MTTKQRDPGILREQLAQELVEWRAAGLWMSARAWSFHRRVRRLARLVGLRRDNVYDQLLADAEAMEAEQARD